MEIIGDTIIFKSLPDLFADERDGIKPNTVRLLSKEEAEQVYEKWGCIDYILINKSMDASVNFKREITNITDITGALKMKLKKEARLFVFSWRHEQGYPDQSQKEQLYSMKQWDSEDLLNI